MITFLDKSENSMMVYPHGEDRCETRQEGEVMGPQGQQSRTESACTKIRNFGHLDGQGQQSYSDSENAIAEGLNSPCFFFIKRL
jgi:hypothetical protein